MRNIFLSIFTLILSSVAAQDASMVKIPQIQGIEGSSPYVNQTLKTEGVVTAVFVGSGMINGFFIQDKMGDSNPNTSDGIFVNQTSSTKVSIGDVVSVSGKVTEYLGRTQIDGDNITILGMGEIIVPQKIKCDLETLKWEKYEGMLIEIEQTLWVNNNYNLERYGELELGTSRKQTPTNLAFPASAEYTSLVNKNSFSPIILDDAYTLTYKNPVLFGDENGTRRTGERVDNLQAVVDYTNSKYVLYPISDVAFYGNARQRTHDDIGNYNLKVCGFNLEYYLSKPNSSSMGPSSQLELERQHTKILDAMLAINADVYGIVEIEQGQHALRKLTAAMNAATGSAKYSFINDGGSTNGTYTKVAYIYRTDKITPYKTLRNINTPTPINRKKIQAFTLKSNNERFIFSINHFKAKSGCSSATGAEADQGDGQSCYNATRIAEAKAVISAINSGISYYADEDVLVMGDLNAYTKEDPVQEFVNRGYVDLMHQFQHDISYSYMYRGEAGNLDHALANESMTRQITGVTAFHINADELSSYAYDGANYQPNMYRSSDHDPIIVGISLGNNVNNNNLPFNEKVKIYPTVVRDFLRIDNAENGHIQIFSLYGIKLFQSAINSSSEILDLKKLGLMSGAYVVRLLGEGKILRQLIFVK